MKIESNDILMLANTSVTAKNKGKDVFGSIKSYNEYLILPLIKSVTSVLKTTKNFIREYDDWDLDSSKLLFELHPLPPRNEWDVVNNLFPVSYDMPLYYFKVKFIEDKNEITFLYFSEQDAVANNTKLLTALANRTAPKKYVDITNFKLITPVHLENYYPNTIIVENIDSVSIDRITKISGVYSISQNFYGYWFDKKSKDFIINLHPNAKFDTDPFLSGLDGWPLQDTIETYYFEITFDTNTIKFLYFDIEVALREWCEIKEYME